PRPPSRPPAVLGLPLRVGLYRQVRLVDRQRPILEAGKIVVGRRQIARRRRDRVCRRARIDRRRRRARQSRRSRQRPCIPQTRIGFIVYKPAQRRRERRVHRAVIGLPLVVGLHRQVRLVDRQRPILEAGKIVVGRRQIARRRREIG